MSAKNIFKDSTGTRIAPASWSQFNVPESWTIYNLGEVCSIQTGNGFKGENFNSEREGWPLVKRATVNGTEGEPTYTTEEFDERYIVREGDVLVSMDGNFEVIIWDGPNSALNQRVCKITSEIEEIDNEYLGYVLQPIIKHCEWSTGGTTVASLSNSQLKKINIPVPPVEEQERIVSLLSDVDEYIEKSSERVTKLQAQKQATLQQIFGNDGEIFKDDNGERIASIVWSRFNMPEEWQSKSLGEIAKFTTGNSFSSEYFVDAPRSNSYPLVRIRDLEDCNPDTYTTEEFDESRYIVNEGDVLIGMDGDFRAQFWTGRPAALNQRVVKVESDSDEVLIEYLGYVLDPIVKQISNAVGGTTVTHLSVGQHLEPCNIPVPTVEEQEKIVSLLSDIDSAIEKTQSDLENMKELKQGLLQEIF